MSTIKFRARVPRREDDPFFQTTPTQIDADVQTFASTLGDLEVSFVPVRPGPEAEAGLCHRNVAEHVALHGGQAVFGYAFWSNSVMLMGEFHAVWRSPTGELIDVTKTAEGEETVCFAWDKGYPADYDFSDWPPNCAMNIVGKADPDTVARAIDGLSPARLDYERRRSDRAGLDLETYLAGKLGRSQLSDSVDELIAACKARESMIVPTSAGVQCSDPKAFRAMHFKVLAIEDRIRRLLMKQQPAKPSIDDDGPNPADGERPMRFFAYYRADGSDQLEGQQAACRQLVASADGTIVEEAVDIGPGITTGMPGYARMHQALEDPNFDVLATDMSVFGATKLLDLHAACKVSRVGFWDLAGGPLTDDQFKAIAEFVASRVARAAPASGAIGEMMRPPTSLN